jgi:hypothetical protein
MAGTTGEADRPSNNSYEVFAMISLHQALKRRRHGLVAAIAALILSTGISFAGSSASGPVKASDQRIQATERGYSLDSRPGETAPVYDPDLIGFWEHRDTYGTVTLFFRSENDMVLGDRDLKYRIVPGAIMLTDNSREFRYPYQVASGYLILTVTDRNERPVDVMFRRVNISIGAANRDFPVDARRPRMTD